MDLIFHEKVTSVSQYYNKKMYLAELLENSGHLRFKVFLCSVISYVLVTYIFLLLTFPLSLKGPFSFHVIHQLNNCLGGMSHQGVHINVKF